MTPSDYKDCYENILVSIGNGTLATVSVHKYMLRSNADLYNAAAWETFRTTLRRRGIDTDLRIDTATGSTRVDPRLTKHADEIKKGNKRDLVLSGVNWTRTDLRVDTRVADWEKLARYAFAGKGSPQACQIVLQLAVNWGLTTNPQDYADSALGLDCNGFVGNYLWHVMRNNPWTDPGVENNNLGPDSPIETGYYTKYKNRLISRWEDLDNNQKYIMMKTDDHGNVINQVSGTAIAHIVVTQPGGRLDRPQNGSNPFAVTVVESTGGAVSPGLSESYYSCLHVSNKVFTIKREAMVPASREFKFKIALFT